MQGDGGDAMQDMSASLLRGDTVFTVMSPDTAVDLTAPDHLEGFEMTPCIVRSTHFWGSADTILIGPDARASAGGNPINFYYSNMRNYFTTVSLSRSAAEAAGRVLNLNLASIQRYKFHEFRAIPDYRLVWDSKLSPDKADLTRAVEGGRRLKMAVQIEEDLWIVHRIAHVRREPGDNYRFVAPALPIPNFLSGAKSLFDSFPEIGPEQGLKVQSGALQGGLSPITSGTCVWYGPNLEPTTRGYLCLRIFENI